MSDLLSVGRAAFQGITGRYGRIGLSADSRQQLEGFYNNATALFNQLFASAENQEVNNRTTILALRSKNKGNLSQSITGTASSRTNGTRVNTEA